MTTTKTYDNLNRLMRISSAPSASSVVSFNYLYNSANQRTLRTDADGSRWRYGYDSLGQVSVGKKYWSDWTPVAGEQYEYAFDDIGNRTSTKVGGDETGSNLRSANYHANSLNQYTNRDVPGYLNILGLAYTTNAVTVNGQSTYRKGEFFRKELPVNNSSAPQWTNITVAANGQTSVTGHEFLPKTQEQFAYDLDGNLISDGRWQYVWDAENRLIGMATNTTVGPQISLKFDYDSKGRRIRKQVLDSSGTVTNDIQFLYDGWNLLSEFRTPQSAFRTYLWGLDLSGSPQGAGGIGGLLSESQVSSGQVTNSCFIAFDGNGNVMALVNATNGALAAQYEYGPFGELLRATGLIAKGCPFHFSTKYQDEETDLLYYGYRFYDPKGGRWQSRDPLGETETLNLVVFSGNTPVSFIDRLGDRRAPSIGSAPASFERASGEPTQLAQFEVSLMADWRKFQSALEALCPACPGAVSFTGGNGKQDCTHDKCMEQAVRLATYLMQDYKEVFYNEYQKFGDILTGWQGNVRANEAPFHGQIAADYDKGFGLKCAGWMDLTSDTFWKSISPFYKEHSQCFRAAIVGSPRDSHSYWNHSWVLIYGPGRGQLNTSMYNKGDYDVNVDPWPFSGRLIMNPHPWTAKRFDMPLLW